MNHTKEMIAPCGINCTYCYVHHKSKKACSGCRSHNNDQPASCRKCKIKACCDERKLYYCYECDNYPCHLIKRLDKSYIQRYQESLIGNMTQIKEEGIERFMEMEKIRLKCPECEGYLNVHDKICSSCGKKFKVNANI